jgi:hypothetical protein
MQNKVGELSLLKKGKLAQKFSPHGLLQQILRVTIMIIKIPNIYHMKKKKKTACGHPYI